MEDEFERIRFGVKVTQKRFHFKFKGSIENENLNLHMRSVNELG